MRALMTFVPLIFALCLLVVPELGEFSADVLLAVFGFGAMIGTVTHLYWLRVLLLESAFYKKFYEESAVKPHKVQAEMHKKHTRILLPFYIFGALMFIIVVFVFGIFGLDATYLLPLALGALEGVPLSYLLMWAGIFS